MDGPLDNSEEAGRLWRRLKSIETGETANAIAALAEGGTLQSARRGLEAELAADPELAADLIAARAVAQQGAGVSAFAEDALDAIIARALALAPEDEAASVVPFAPRRSQVPGQVPGQVPATSEVSGISRSWRGRVRWAALAASLALVGWFGIAMGSDAYRSIASLEGQATSTLGSDLLDAPAGLFEPSETSGT